MHTTDPEIVAVSLAEVARTIRNVCTSYGDSEEYAGLVAGRVRQLLALPDDQGQQCDFPGCPRTDTGPVPDYSREPVVSVPLCPEHAGPQHGEE